MQVSHSRVECYKHCPYQYKLRYIDKLKTLPPEDANNALIIGTALHEGVEKDTETAIKNYYRNYPIITDQQIEEAIKLEHLIPQVKNLLPDTGRYETKISTSDFIGYIDFLMPATVFKRGVEVPNQFNLVDFKYSNNKKNYMESAQLHLYKYFFEKNLLGMFIRKLYFLFVPKVQIKPKKTETQIEFRNRLKKELVKQQPELVEVEYNPNKVIEFLLDVKQLLEAQEYPKKPSYLCNWCEFKKYCEEGIDYMLLPKNERRNIENISKRVVWIYGAPFSGKTFFANQFPDPLMLNTDGNIRFVDAPYISIKDNVTVEGRRTIRTLAWQIFKDTIAELEKKENVFKTIVVDLLEDMYEHCRIYMYDQMGITHESDDSFRAWDKVTTEFLSTLKRLMNLNYENIILLSHEDSTKDITKKSGDKITSIKPNIREKIANKIAGMVDIVARAIAENDVYTLNFKQSEVVFGGGRFAITETAIPSEYEAFIKLYDDANLNPVVGKTPKKRRIKKTEEPEVTEPVIEEPEVESEVTDAEADLETEEVIGEPTMESEEPVEEPKPRTRTRRTRRTE